MDDDRILYLTDHIMVLVGLESRKRVQDSLISASAVRDFLQDPR